jgi:HTH domain
MQGEKMELSQKHLTEVLKPRGIDTTKVIVPERYVSYEPSDETKINRLAWLGKNQKKSARVRAIRRSPGLLIRRYGFTETSLSNAGRPWAVWEPASALRPDNPEFADRKYIYTEGHAQGIDLHPNRSREWFWRHGPLSPTFFCLEGALKADAALDYDWQAIDVASVTCWDGKDLRPFGASFRKCPVVFVVTDSDWSLINSQGRTDVWNQAIKCVERLQGLGINAIHVAPRLLCAQSHEHTKYCKTGLDDAIGAPGEWNAVEGMLVIPRMPQDAPAAASTSASEVYRWLLANRRRRIKAYTGHIANALGVSKKTVWRAVDDLERLGKVEFRPGKRFRAASGWASEPNTYILATPETLTLAELGYEWFDLTMIAPDTEDTRTRVKRAQKLGEQAVKATDTRVTPPPCEGCGKPLEGKVRATKRFHGPTCRKQAERAEQRAAA